jgi:hypothetical protein
MKTETRNEIFGPQEELQMLAAFVRDPGESYAIFQDTCFDRDVTSEQLLVELVTKPQLRVVELEAKLASLERALSPQLKDAAIRRIIAAGA